MSEVNLSDKEKRTVMKEKLARMENGLYRWFCLKCMHGPATIQAMHKHVCSKR